MTAVFMAACDPSPAPDLPEEAHADLEIGAAGGAALSVHVAAQLVDRLIEEGPAIGRSVFHDFDWRLHRDGNNGGVDFLVLSVKNLYEPGPAPLVDVSTAGLRDVLAGVGVKTMRLSVCGPYVPLAFEADPPPQETEHYCAYWRLAGDDPPPHVILRMHPDPARWWRGFAVFLLIALSTAVSGLTRAKSKSRTTRRRTVVVGASLVGVIACGVGIATAIGGQGDNLGVRGQLEGLSLSIASYGSLMALPLGLVCLAYIVESAMR